MVARFNIALAALALAACTSTYHPEYHPVTVTTVQETTNAPVALGGGTPAVIAPATTAPPPLVVPEPPLADPSVVFR